MKWYFVWVAWFWFRFNSKILNQILSVYIGVLGCFLCSNAALWNFGKKWFGEEDGKPASKSSSLNLTFFYFFIKIKSLQMRLGGDGLLEASREQLIAENKKQESYIASLLSKLDGNCTSGKMRICIHVVLITTTFLWWGLNEMVLYK